MSRVPMFTPSELPRKAGMGTYMSPGIQRRHGVAEFSQFTGAAMIAAKYGFTKETLDRFALTSHERASMALREGRFNGEILPVSVRRADGSGGDELHTADEGIRLDATLEGIAAVKLLKEGGVITAASASQIADGATGVMVVSERALKTFGLKPLARIHHMSVIGHDPVIMLEAPIPATQAALRKAGLRIEDIDAYEVNEAFAPVPLAWLQVTGADPQRLNVNGGAIALGHPLGASGTKLMTTLINVLQQRGGRYGLQTMCEGGGMANVTIIERL